jgi:simple sugar transport system permease protein
MLVRFSRNAVLVLSLLIPILAGLGLNFGIVLGAMAGQIAAILVTSVASVFGLAASRDAVRILFGTAPAGCSTAPGRGW